MTEAAGHPAHWLMLPGNSALPATVSKMVRTLGISPRLAYEIEQRPFFVTKDGTGKPVMEVLQHSA